MARLHANVSFRFESESVEAAGADLRRLADAAERTGFELIRGKVTPAPPDDENEGWTSYARLDSEPNQ
jgi:hypothetical protein